MTNPELDAVYASMEKSELDNWLLIATTDWTHGPGVGEFRNPQGTSFYSFDKPITPYSTDPAESNALLIRMAELGWMVSLHGGKYESGMNYGARFWRDNPWKEGGADDASLKMAIALAAKAALEAQ